MCDKCGKKWKKLPSAYPNGPCEWKCPDCGEEVSPCCGAEIIDAEYDKEDEVHVYCGVETCSKCGKYCHCGGCI